MTGRTDQTEQGLAPEIEIALAHALPRDRPAYRALFLLDNRLAEIVAGSSEIMIGQLRLAWWRDVLSTEPALRPSGEPTIAALGESWGDAASGLTDLVDAWEALLVAEALDEPSIKAFVTGRAGAWRALAAGPLAIEHPDPAEAYARQWIFADLLAHVSDPAERELVRQAVRGEAPPRDKAIRSLVPLAILANLGRRSLARGGRPLMEGRGAALLALRTAVFRR